MTNYLLFMGDHYYPSKFGDYKACSNSFETIVTHALEIIDRQQRGYGHINDWIQIVMVTETEAKVVDSYDISQFLAIHNKDSNG